MKTAETVKEIEEIKEIENLKKVEAAFFISARFLNLQEKKHLQLFSLTSLTLWQQKGLK